MIRRRSAVPVLAVTIVALLALARAKSIVQGGEVPRTPEAVVRMARETFGDGTKRGQLTRKAYLQLRNERQSRLWFNDFEGRIIDSMRVIAEDVPIQRKKKYLWSVADVAEEGDVLRVSWTNNGKQGDLTLVYMGEQSFPDVSSRTFSFFVFPYRTRLEYNTLPARNHSQYIEAQIQKNELAKLTYSSAEYTSQDGDRRVAWLKPSTLRRNVFLTSAIFNGTGRFTVYRAFDSGDGPQFQNFDHPELAQTESDIEAAWRDALALSSRCLAELEKPTPSIRKLLQLTFSIPANGNAENQIAQVRDVFRTGLAALKQARFVYLGEEVLIPASDAEAATDRTKNIIYIRKSFFSKQSATLFKACGGDRALFQASTLMHEGIHFAPPTHFSESQIQLSHQGHWGGIPDRLQIDEPTSLGLNYRDAYRNPYSYHYFGIWLGSEMGGPSRDELLVFLRNAADYRQVLDGIRIDFDDVEEVFGGCQYRAHAICQVMRNQYPEIDCRKIFAIASGFPKPTIEPSRNGNPITGLVDGKQETARWAFHVAPLIEVGGERWVYDLSLFPKPVTVDVWRKALHDQSSPRIVVRTAETYRPAGNSTATNIKWLKY